MKSSFLLYMAIIAMVFVNFPSAAFASYHFSNYQGQPPIHVLGKATRTPQGLSPQVIKKIYNLPNSGGHGTIAIIGAYDNKNIGGDLNTFSAQFGLPSCNAVNACFEKHVLANGTKTNSGWTMETTLDVEWAHAIAPTAKILLVEAPTQSGKNLTDAVDYARSRSDVVAISMSWGGPEYAEELTLDSHFQSKYGAIFFASSGDSGAGAGWPAASPYVVSVGGTSLSFGTTGSFKSETAWTGSGGGISAYENEPLYQKNYSITRALGKRSIPDVSYDADPKSGFSIYANGGWYVVGGTSAGAPQWAAIHSLGLSVSHNNLYNDKSSQNNGKYFRDITTGTNGDCGYYCNARSHYDYVTGLGSPLTINF